VRGCNKGSEEGTEGRELASRNKGETVKMERKKMTRGIKERRRVQRESCRVFKRRAAEKAKQVNRGKKMERGVRGARRDGERRRHWAWSEGCRTKLLSCRPPRCHLMRERSFSIYVSVNKSCVVWGLTSTPGGLVEDDSFPRAQEQIQLRE